MKLTIINLYRAAKKFIGAMTKHVSLPLAHCSPGTLGSALKKAKTKRAEHVAGTRATRVAATKQKKLREATIVFVNGCRDALIADLGRDWSSAWIPAGWRVSVAAPRVLDKLVELLDDLHQFLTDNPGLEDEEHQLTVADVQDWLDQLEAAEQNLSAAKTAQRLARTEREKAEDSLMEQAQGLVAELKLILPEQDQRWIEFVGEVPSDERRPEPVEVLVLSGEVPGELDADWEASVRSERFQVWVLVTGVDKVFRHALTVKDTNATIPDLPPGAEVKVRIVAANAAGEAAPSDEETAKVPARVVAA